MSISEKATEFAGLPVEDYHPEVGLVLPAMPRREFRQGDGGDTWAITLERDRLTTEPGPGGAKETTTFTYPEAAQERYRELVFKRVGEGYVEQKAAGGSVRDAIFAALAADPDDVTSRMALADYLAEQGEALPAVAYRVDGDEYGEEGYGTLRRLRAFLAEPGVGLVPALVVGSCWAMADAGKSSAEIVEALVAARGRLRNLRGLFLGDIVYSEWEISWIKHDDVTALFDAFPKLEHFRVRGGDGLVLRPFRHESLKSLVIEASNLSREVVRNVGASDLPALEHLEVWLGTDEYGADSEVNDLQGVLQGRGLPSLRRLGLRNSEITDDIAAALAGAPVMERLRVLDLSLGTLTDRGAEALLAAPGIGRLEKLDIHHHYLSPEMVERLKARGIEVDASDPKVEEDVGEDEGYRYVAHSE